MRDNEPLPANYRNLERALQPPEVVYRNEWHNRYHDAQASTNDTALKRLVQRANLLDEPLPPATLQCACGDVIPF
jgi:hypothetical protein